MPRYIFLAGFLLLLIADQRVLPSLPIYVLDGVCLIWLGYAVVSGRFKQIFPSPLALVLLSWVLLSAVGSLGTHPITLTNLGQYKSWLLLPSVAAFGYWLWEPNGHRDLFRFWYAGIVVILLSLIPFVWAHQLTYDGRLTGWYTSPNFLGFFVFPGVLLACQALGLSRDVREKCFHLAVGGATLVVLSMTHSYAAWLATGVSVVVWILLTKRTKLRTLLLSLTGVAVVAGTMLLVDAQHSSKLEMLLTGAERSSLASRMMIWESAKEMLSEHPVLGIGIGNFQQEYLKHQVYFEPYLEWAVPQPHNLMLALWLETGLVGLLGCLGLVGSACYWSFQKRAESSVQILFALFAGILAYGLIDTPLFGNALAFVFWTTLFGLIPLRENYNSMR